VSAAVSLAPAPVQYWSLREEQIARIVRIRAHLHLDQAKRALDALEGECVRVLDRADALEWAHPVTAEARRAGIVLGDARERVLHWVGVVLRAEYRLAEELERPHRRCSCVSCRTEVSPCP
jgi:hypothetical protein